MTRDPDSTFRRRSLCLLPLWEFTLQGHLRTQDYEDADGDALKPLSHLREIDWKRVLKTSLFSCTGGHTARGAVCVLGLEGHANQ